MDGTTWNGSNLRPIFAGLLAAGPIQVMSGVLPGGGAWFVNAGSGMSVTVGTGVGVIAASSGVTAGGYLCAVNTVTTLTITGSDAVNPRIDLVCATVSDVGSSASAWLLQVITGIPAGSPVAPSLPANSFALATVLVPANSLSVSSGNITDLRVFTAAQGGIIPVPNLSGGAAALTPYQGLYVHDRSSLRLARIAVGGAVLQPTLLPIAPQQARNTSTVGSAVNGLTVAVASITVTVDGSTDLEIVCKWPNVTMSSGGAYGASIFILLDGLITLAEVNVSGNSAGPQGDGGTLHHVTMSGADRLSAGTHTIEFAAQFQGDGVHPVEIVATGNAPATLYVRPVPL